jgi:hypothetical protein
MTLIAIRQRPPGAESAAESRRWLRAIESRLTPRLTLGARLRASAPRYAGFAVDAAIEVSRGRDPEEVATAVRSALERRLAAVGPDARDFGASVTRLDVAVWIRAVSGVQRIATLALRPANGNAEAPEIAVSRYGLPRLDAANIEAVRPQSGSAR